MSNDEQQDSLAAQAAAWVPPWERPARDPDRAYQAAAEAEARAELAGKPGESDRSDEPVARFGESDDEERSEASLSDDDDFDEAFEGANPPGYSGSVSDEPVSDEPAADQPGDEESADDEPATDQPGDEEPAGDESAAEAPEVSDEDEVIGIDVPVGDDLDRDPTDVGGGPEVSVPGAIEQAVEFSDDDEPGAPVDAPLPADGDDAGDVFDQAADDDVSDDDEVDLPVHELEPDDESDEPDGEPGETADQPAETDDEPDEPAAAASEGDLRGEVSEESATVIAGTADGGAANGSASNGRVAGGDSGKNGSGRKRAGRRADASAAAVPGQATRVRGGSLAVGDSTSRTEEVIDDLPPLMEEAELSAALEAILLVVDEPVAEMQLAQILEQPTERVGTTLEDISARYTAAGHGFDLRRAAGGWRLYTRPEYAPYVERFVLDGQSVRLTQAALETLAVVAYKQPVTRSRISAIRGVNCDGVMRTLVTRGLIEECGTEGETGAYLYRTTPIFLEKLGLNSIDQLPPLAPFLPDDVEEVLDASG